MRGSRKNLIKSCKFVKVAVDGAPYLRKMDLEMYNSYQQLLGALEDLFTFLTIRMYLNLNSVCNFCYLVKTHIIICISEVNVGLVTVAAGNDMNERKLLDLANGVEYVLTYEDRDGDWMLVGDVPWK